MYVVMLSPIILYFAFVYKLLTNNVYTIYLFILSRVTKHSSGKFTTVVARGGNNALRKRETGKRDSTTASTEVFYACMYVCMYVLYMPVFYVCIP